MSFGQAELLSQISQLSINRALWCAQGACPLQVQKPHVGIVSLLHPIHLQVDVNHGAVDVSLWFQGGEAIYGGAPEVRIGQ